MIDRLKDIIEKGKTLFGKYYRYYPYLSLIFGFATIILWERGFEFVQWIFIYLIVIAITTLIIIRLLRGYAERKRLFSYSIIAIDFINQNLYQDMLFFLLPIYWSSVTVMSLNITFVLVLLILCLITAFDNLYKSLLLRNTYIRYAFFVFVLFGFLNFSLPVLLGIKNIWSLYLSIFISILILTPLFIGAKGGEYSKKYHAFYIIAIGILSFLLLSISKPFIPPVPLSVKHGVVSTGIDRNLREPIAPFKKIRSSELSEVYCYTRIFAPHGVKERLWHVWKRDGVVVQKVQLNISGGRKEGFRTWSKKTLRENDAGSWAVDVVTDGGQLVGRVRFKIV